MRTHALNYRRFRRTMVLAGAVAAALANSSRAGAQTEFVISTGGATALGAFTRMNSNATSPTLATIVRGPLAVGGTVTIGSTTYTPQPGVTYMGIANTLSPLGGGIEPTSSQDRLLYYYRESGSIAGVLDLVDSNGLRAATPGTEYRPADPAANLFLWANGSRFNSTAAGYSSGTTPNTVVGSPNTGRVNGRNYTTGLSPTAETTPNGQPLMRIAWSDVKFEQAFAVGNSGATFTSSPTASGYGLGRGNIGATNFQQLRNASAIIGGTDPTTTRLRNQDVAVVPFLLIANPGTGLAEVTKEQGAWLQMVGRLPNGVDFNSSTREIGSGTRNQGDLNLGVDPSWGGGERDRRATAGYDTFDINGNPVHVNVGDEADPVLSLAGSTTQDRNENRISPTVRFADKISGSSGIRATVSVSRMSLGILSAGDARASSGSALEADRTTSAAPLRSLKIDWDNDGPNAATTPTAANVSNGAWEMWSVNQAITVAPYANPTANDVGATAYKPINGDINDQNIGSATSSTEPGVHRKFLDNITKSISTYSAGGTLTVTPTDFILQGAFIPTQLMQVKKQYDGGTVVPKDTNNGDVFDQALYNEAIGASNGILNEQTNWADPSVMNGGLNLNAVKYTIFSSANQTASTANRSIIVNSRTNLAGDFNGDNVRDAADVAAMAYAYANPDAYLATPASGDPNGRNYNGVAATIPDSGSVAISTGTNANVRDTLIVMSDFNSNGNVAHDSNDGSFTTTAVERADVRYFLYGATVDTSAYDTGADAAAKAKNRRENGVRFGQLKKNQAIDTFNTTLNSFVGTVVNPATGLSYTQPQVDALKFDKFDVNGDGVRNRADAKIVDRNVGKNMTVLTDVLSTSDDLVAAELEDNLSITHIVDINGNSDFKLMHDALPGILIDGDANFDGIVNIADLRLFAVNFLGSVDQWSDGDFTFDGMVDRNDLQLLAQNWQGTAGDLGSALAAVGLPAAVPEPATLGLLGLAGTATLLRRKRRAE